MKHSKKIQSAFRVDVMEEAFLLGKQELYSASPLEKALVQSRASSYDLEEVEIKNCLRDLDTLKEDPMITFVPEDLSKAKEEKSKKK